MRVIIEEHQRGLVYKDGKLVRWLEPGRHSIWGWGAELRVDRLHIDEGYHVLRPEMERILPQGAGQELVVGDAQVAVLRVDERPVGVLEAGRYVLWQLRAQVRATIYRVDEILADDLADSHAALMPNGLWDEVVLGERERGLLYADGVVVGWLDSGRHRYWTWSRRVHVERLQLDQGYVEATPEMRAVVPEGAATELVVAPDEVAIVRVDGRPTAMLEAGTYLLWQMRARVEATCYATDTLLTAIPEDSWSLVPETILREVTVMPYQRGMLYLDGKFELELEAGRYGFHSVHRRMHLELVDLRERELQVQGQEVMSADKVTLRINLIVKWRVVDARASIEQTDDLGRALYAEAQMAARRYVASSPIDALLEDRQQASEAMWSSVRQRAREWGVDVLQIDLKDLILPGDMKQLLNQVIEAEKRAAANVIMRREETAATRAQANTAKMMENNPTLLRLKELETLKDMAAQVDQLQVIAGADELMRRVRLSPDSDHS